MKEVLKNIIQNSRWTYPIFDGAIIVEGRILSPNEAEICGLSSALIAKSILNDRQIERISKVKEEELKEEESLDDIINILQQFDPDKILKMAESQDKILTQCVCRASVDKGVKWQDFKLVLNEQQQSANANRLWVGMLEDKDRKAMIDLCLQGHKKATESIRRSL
jgi:hypothetical protein|tara:strand:- start:252 stop:746 length:495 start_codon:yes stop_codon:yes gene_type:complete